MAPEDFLRWFKLQPMKCHYCGITLAVKPSLKTQHHNWLSIDRCVTHRGYVKNNMVICCQRCNAFKADMLTKEDMEKIGKILEYRRNHL